MDCYELNKRSDEITCMIGRGDVNITGLINDDSTLFNIAIEQTISYDNFDIYVHLLECYEFDLNSCSVSAALTHNSRYLEYYLSQKKTFPIVDDVCFAIFDASHDSHTSDKTIDHIKDNIEVIMKNYETMHNQDISEIFISLFYLYNNFDIESFIKNFLEKYQFCFVDDGHNPLPILLINTQNIFFQYILENLDGVDQIIEDILIVSIEYFRHDKINMVLNMYPNIMPSEIDLFDSRVRISIDRFEDIYETIEIVSHSGCAIKMSADLEALIEMGRVLRDYLG